MAVERGPHAPEAVVAIGASAGGVEILRRVVADLPGDLGAAVLVVVHVPAIESRLPQILARAGNLPALHPEDGEPPVADRIYVARPDHHLLVERDRLRVVRGPTENGHRPAIDPLLRSARARLRPARNRRRPHGIARRRRRRKRRRGAAGRGGTVIVQDPEQAPFPSMPLSAIAADHPDFVVKAERMGQLVSESVKKVRSLPRQQAVAFGAESLVHAQSEGSTTRPLGGRPSEHDGMPAAAIATGAADSVVSLEEIAAAIRAFVGGQQPN